LIAKGLGTGEIASRLHLSRHTVRDHVKAIFEKVDVSSRGELVARLFAEHYAPVHARD
jgi:DNA-binding CsgD family transcriptional regulator